MYRTYDVCTYIDTTTCTFPALLRFQPSNQLAITGLNWRCETAISNNKSSVPHPRILNIPFNAVQRWIQGHRTCKSRHSSPARPCRVIPLVTGLIFSRRSFDIFHTSSTRSSCGMDSAMELKVVWQESSSTTTTRHSLSKSYVTELSRALVLIPVTRLTWLLSVF